MLQQQAHISMPLQPSNFRSQKLNILVLHDFLATVENTSEPMSEIAGVFAEAGLEINWQQAVTEEEYRDRLKQPLDLILWDFAQTSLALTKVTSLLAKNKLTIPLLVINGSHSTRAAITAIKAGATDYLTSEELNQLPTAAKKAIAKPNLSLQLAAQKTKSQQQIQQLITENADGILVVDRQKIVRFVNPAALKLFNKLEAELIDYPLGFPVVNGDYLEVDIPQKDKTTIVAQMRVSEIEWQGKKASIVSLRDITKLKQAEEERIQLLKQTQAANRSKDEFLAVLSHELRTPLNPILGWAQILSRGGLSQAQVKQGAAIIQRNAQLQTKLIEDILDISRIIRGKLSLQTTPVNLTTVIKNTLETVQLSANAKSIQIDTDLDSNVGLVQGDATRLQQVVWNILSNGIKFTPNGGKIAIKLTSVETTDKFAPQAMIQIEDTGKGIDSEFLPYVFDYFRQAESTTNRSEGGLGLGLAIVRRLVELHGGEVTVSSSGIGQGTTFTILLPTMEQSVKSAGNKNLPQQKPSLADINILVVDDDDGSRELLMFVLEIEGANIQGVESATKALTQIESFQPDILISDIAMPEVDGYELIKKTRAMPSTKKIKAIALSAYASEQDQQKSLAAGFDCHVNKPLDITNFVDVVTQLVNG